MSPREPNKHVLVRSNKRLRNAYIIKNCCDFHIHAIILQTTEFVVFLLLFSSKNKTQFYSPELFLPRPHAHFAHRRRSTATSQQRPRALRARISGVFLLLKFATFPFFLRSLGGLSEMFSKGKSGGRWWRRER